MWTTMTSPVGDLRIVAIDGAITGIDFLGELPEGDRESRSVQQYAARASRVVSGERVDDDPLLVEAVRQLTAYFAGELTEFDLPVDPPGTPFQRSVWAELRRIGYGEVATYGEVARRLGKTGHGARAVGLANGRNPVPIVVPCHRVVGSDGALTGYGGGMARKRALLDLEQTHLF